MTNSPTFSIVIPTRNRSATLKWTLRTCLDIEYLNFEVVISDNDSSDDTAAVVAAFDDARIQYFRTPTYVSMGRNFENGLRCSRGEFLIFIGDDDGIMPFSLRALDLAFEKNPEVDYINWHHIGFVWPQARETRQSLNWLNDLGRLELETPTQTWRRISRPRSADANEMNGYNLYHACIRRSGPDAAAAAGVRIFASPCPDVASGIRILRFVRRKLRLPMALTAIGLSPRSNSLAARAVRMAIQSEAQESVRSEFVTTNAAEYPDAALVHYSLKRLHRAIQFLGPLIDEHLARFGDLHELDTDIWRMIFIESIAGTTPEDLDGYVGDFNEIAAWMRERGATGRKALAPGDIEPYLKGESRLPQYYGQPFRFSDKAVAEARELESKEPLDHANGRILAIYQDAKQMWLHVRAIGEEYTIHDHIKVTSAIVANASHDPARLLVEDPAIFQAHVVLSVLERFAQREAPREACDP